MCLRLLYAVTATAREQMARLEVKVRLASPDT
jgi:hypothetical protein